MNKHEILDYLRNFISNNEKDGKDIPEEKNVDQKLQPAITSVQECNFNDICVPKFTNEFWTAKQRQASSIHEISYRACFKPQLPRFFINLLTQPGDIVYDPFSGRGTTVIEAGLLNRRIILNDINPLSTILAKPRFHIPTIKEVQDRLNHIKFDYSLKAEIDLSMFYHPKTEAEIVSLKNYLHDRLDNNPDESKNNNMYEIDNNKENDNYNANDKDYEKNKNSGPESEFHYIDAWIRMIATNRLTGHSDGFFSVYTFPPNQAILPERQVKINLKRNQIPPYKEIKPRILKKTLSILRNLTHEERQNLDNAGRNATFITSNAGNTPSIQSESVQLIITSPPFLNIVQYKTDNWLRCWFNSLDAEAISRGISVTGNIDKWTVKMKMVFKELFRITKPGGWVAFEVGEVRRGKIKLDEIIVPIGVENGFSCVAIIINAQKFTKTSNIWGISNNSRGTNTNRIVLFQKLKK